MERLCYFYLKIFLKMKLHLTQKIGLGGITFILLISFVFYLGNYFSPFMLAFTIPFFVLVLIGYSINNSNKTREE
jgi:hypothetical protein